MASINDEGDHHVQGSGSDADPPQHPGPQRGSLPPGACHVRPRRGVELPWRQHLVPQHRPSQAGRAAFATHQGKAEIEAFLRRYVDNHIHMEVEDILVNGPPWNTRAAVRVHHWITGPDGKDLYSNRAVLMVRTAWGKIRSQEDYEDTERVSAFDASHPTIGALDTRPSR